MSQNPKQLYKARVGKGELKPDPVQEKAVNLLDTLHAELLSYKPKRGWFSKKQMPPKGVYMHGGVGRGKSMLMDLFYETLPEDIPKRRVHFHEFMIEVHNYIHSRRDVDNIREGVDAALPMLSERIYEASRVLCFDEFHITDITDAMILGRLFRHLFERGVVVVATSNWAPDRLYEGGLKRDRFLPFIALLKGHVHVMHLDNPTDYRTQFLAQEGVYFTPLNDATQAKMDEAFARVTDNVESVSETLTVKGREIEVEAAAKGAARFTFAQLCERPHGAEDYIKIAESYSTVFLEGIPKMGYDRRNEIKRLMNLIDALYEAGTKVVISAVVSPDKLYHGDDHAFEFERTISRLQEMQSAEYLEKA